MDEFAIVVTIRDETGEQKQVRTVEVYKPMLKEFGLCLEGHEELVDFSRSMIRLDMHFIFLFF